MIVVLFVVYNVIRRSAGTDAAFPLCTSSGHSTAITGVPWVAVPACYIYALMHYAANA